MRRLSRRSRHASLAALVRELPPRALLPLGVAIFSVFSLLGLVIDLMNGGGMPPAVVLRNMLLSGSVALAYAFGLIRRNRWVLAGAIVVQVLWLRLASGSGAPTAAPHLAADGIGLLILMIVSYTSFLSFINGTAARYMRVSAEMELAHQIHQVLVPTIATRCGDHEVFGLSTPSGEVGGDLVDVVGGEAGWIAYVADVSGHGVSSGVVMGMFKSALRMRWRQPGSLGDLLTDLNDVLYPLKNSAMYVTAACIRGATGETFEYAVAGHLPILRVTRDGTVDEITTPQIPIGMFDRYAFTSGSLTCAAGDLLVLITDGLIEVFDSHDQELGLDAMKALLAESVGLPLREIADAIVGRARAHGTQLDDQTLLLMRILKDGRRKTEDGRRKA